MASSPWCRSIAIDKKENYVVVGFENSTVRFFKTTTMEQPREDRLHVGLHQDCSRCPSVDTLAFSHDGLALLASTRSAKTGIIQLYLWRFPFLKFQELTACRYHVPLHESEDNGLSSALFRTGPEGESGLICVTTWTQSGAPILVQSQGGHRSAIRSDVTGRHGKLGNRIQCAAFSPTGTELAMVNDKGHLYQVSNLNSSPIDIKRLSTSKELTAKSNSFSMGYMTLGDEESIVLAWADSSKAIGWIKKIPVTRVSWNGEPCLISFIVLRVHVHANSRPGKYERLRNRRCRLCHLWRRHVHPPDRYQRTRLSCRAGRQHAASRAGCDRTGDDAALEARPWWLHPVMIKCLQWDELVAAPRL
jgi:hypothetical protein